MSSALVLWLLLADPTPPAEPPLRLELLASPTFGMEVGVRDVSSLRQLVFLYDAVLSKQLAFEESTVFRRVLGILGRAAKLGLVDAPVTEFFDTVEHEVFGHGARAREAGLSPTFDFALPFPYQYLLAPQQTFSGFATFPVAGVADHDLPLIAGGIEANLFSGHFAALRAFRSGGRVHYAESLHYLVAPLSYVSRWADAQVLGDRQDGSDVDTYVRLLQQRFNRSGHKSQLELSQRLRRGYVTTFLDPLWWISVYDVLVRYLGKGERLSVVPQLQLGAVKLFPLTRFELSPFGGQHTVEVMISAPRFTLDVSVRGTSSGLATSYGAGARLFRWEVHPTVEVGASLDVWAQPELLPEYRNAFDSRTLPGASGMIEASWRPIDHLGLVAQLGAKSRGYVISQPLSEGVFGFAGLTVYGGKLTSPASSEDQAARPPAPPAP